MSFKEIVLESNTNAGRQTNKIPPIAQRRSIKMEVKQEEYDNEDAEEDEECEEYEAEDDKDNDDDDNDFDDEATNYTKDEDDADRGLRIKTNKEENEEGALNEPFTPGRNGLRVQEISGSPY